MGGTLVVVRPGLGVGAHHERAAVDEDLGRAAVRSTRWRRDGRAVPVAVHELEGRQHRLVVLVLVLDDHPVHETVVQQRAVERHAVEDIERPFAHVGDIGPRLRRPQQWQ